MAENELTALQKAFESMTDDDVDAWLAAGEFESVRGVPLPPDAAAKVAALVSGAEVEGFTLDFNAMGGMQLPPLDGSETSENTKGGKGGALFRHCCTGQHIKSANVTL